MQNNKYILLFFIITLSCTPNVTYKTKGVAGIGFSNSLPIDSPHITNGGELNGKRSKASIGQIIMKNLAALRYVYNKRLKENHLFFGQLNIEFRIDSVGEVISVRTVASTTKDSIFDSLIVAKIKQWRFNPLNFPDTTRVVYPFTFITTNITSKMIEERDMEVNKVGPRDSYKLRKRIETLRNLVNLDCCYSNNDSIKGTIIVEMTIKKDGAVENLMVIENSLNDTTFFTNALQKIRSFDFGRDQNKENTVLKTRFFFDKVNMICPKTKAAK